VVLNVNVVYSFRFFGDFIIIFLNTSSYFNDTCTMFMMSIINNNKNRERKNMNLLKHTRDIVGLYLYDGMTSIAGE